jgi:hypothetical protein
MKLPPLIGWSLVVVLLTAYLSFAFGDAANVPARSSFTTASSSTDLEIAARFAPILHQALGDKPRSDYITNFDFDGDWRGDNNWEHTDDKKFALRGYVYYAVTETKTHYFIHYAVFHPRDYKGGETKGRILSEIIHEGTKRGTEFDPTGLMEEAGVAHENDMEGCLVVVAKAAAPSAARVVFLETLRHSNFSEYLPGEPAGNGFGTFRVDGQRVLLYVEPKGHGIEPFLDDEKQTAKRELIIYSYKGKAENPEQQKDSSVGYDLLSLQTLWTRAKSSASNITYGSTYNYGEITINVVQAKGNIAVRKITVGKVGQAFLGNTGGVNMARPPWSWFDKNARDRPLGRWFFDPAATITRDFKLDESFSTAYMRLPFWAK